MPKKNRLATLLLSLHLLAPIAVLAQDAKPKNPLDYSLGQYAVILGFSLLGGLVSWYTKVRKGDLPLWSISNLIGELATSAFAGLLCFWICEWAAFPPLLTAAMTGIFGHMGARGITLLEDWGKARLPSLPTNGS